MGDWWLIEFVFPPQGKAVGILFSETEVHTLVWGLGDH